MNKLLDYQVEGVDYMTTRPHSLNADPMGMGKTIQTIAALNKLQANTMLVICPATVKYYWARKIREWATRPYRVQVLEGMKANVNPNAEIIILNYALLLSPIVMAQLKKRIFSIGVIDESHYLQSIRSQRSKLILGRSGIIRNCIYKFCLSGTPLTRPIDLYPILRTLANDCLGEYSDYKDFAYRYCGAWWDNYNGILNVDGASNCEEFKAMLKPFMIRRNDADCLPDVVYDLVPVHIPNYIETAAHVATQRQETALEKIEYTAEFISDMVKTIDKLVVFYYHKSVGNALAELLMKLRVGFCKIDGSCNAKQKDDVRQYYIHSKEHPVGLFQFQAAGEGMDGLQEVCNHALFFEGSWIARDIMQAVGRLKRKGQENVVYVQFLAVEDSIEYVVMNKMIKNRKLIRKVID